MVEFGDEFLKLPKGNKLTQKQARKKSVPVGLNA